MLCNYLKGSNNISVHINEVNEDEIIADVTVHHKVD